MPEDQDELQLDERIETSQASSDDGLDSFPDPEFDGVEQPEPSGEVSPAAEAGDPILPAGSQPHTATPTIPDYGFAPAQASPPPWTPTPQPQTTQFFSVAQLQQGVDDGLITSNQMIEQLQLQNREQAKQEAVQAMRQESQHKIITTQLEEYRQAIPGWDQQGSPANQKALPAYQRLLGLGLPETDTTRLLALEQTFGPMTRIKEARMTRTHTAASRDTVQEVGRRGAPPSSRATKDPLSILAKEELALYRDLIAKGDSYKNWNDVRAEILSAATQTSNHALRESHVGLLK